MRAVTRFGALFFAAALALTPGLASAQPAPWRPPGGGPGFHHPGGPGGPGGPGPGWHRPPGGPGGWHRPPGGGYHRYHWRDGYYYDDTGAMIAAGIVGLAVGAAVAGSAQPREYIDDDHIERCLDRYRSYDPRTDTFLGRDGRRHYCNL